MNIIVVSGRLAATRTITLTRAQIVTLAGILLLLVAAAATFLTYSFVSGRAGPSAAGSGVLALADTVESAGDHNNAMRETVQALAVRMGQMQAQLLRLDSLGERLARLSGIKPHEFAFDQIPGRGGALHHVPQQDLTVSLLTRQLDELSGLLALRSDQLDVLDSILMQNQLSQKLLPSMSPIDGGWFSSNFGWRIDPFNGRRALHEGVDFVAPVGTPILAAAGGVVVASEYHPEYGNMVEIDHGNNLVTRYAHASKRLVNLGDIVLRGQKIGAVGSTGRSTGPHLHFEVRNGGVAVNPTRFLKAKR
ncbi:MAG: M23 family metallopeptidase [Pseudomonadota bacterium]